LLLGAGESRTVKLEEAVEAYREALQELTRARVPLDWAATQMNLGVALASLGARESGTAAAGGGGFRLSRSLAGIHAGAATNLVGQDSD
jgi:hypothetical protein